MTLGGKLNTYIEQIGEKQAALAMAWLERWKVREPGKKGWSDTTVISQLNRLLKDQEQGLRFFFQDRSRGMLLFEVLRIPDEAHAELFALADQSLRTEGAPAQIIIDATGFSCSMTHVDALFAELKRLIIMEGPYPVALVLLESQYDRLPRSFDSLLNKEKLRLVQVKTPEQGREQARELAEEQGLVLSANRFPEFERWLAADFGGATLRTEPPDGLELFRRQGRLPSLDPVTYDLGDLVLSAQVWSGELGSACDIHRLMRALRSETSSVGLNENAVTRQSKALALGISATSTARERMDAAIQELGCALPISIKKSSAAELKERLSQAQRRRIEPLALCVGDTVHLLNVSDAARFADGRPWVHVYDIQPKPTPLSLLLEGVADWSEFDFLLDPFLDGLISRLDPEREQHDAFLHARAGLLLNQALEPKPVKLVSDWKPIMTRLLEGEPPAALLRIPVTGEQILYAHQMRLPFVVTQSRLKQFQENIHHSLHQVPPVVDSLVLRGDAPFLVIGKRLSLRGYGSDVPNTFLPGNASGARNSDLWLDLYENQREKGHTKKVSWYHHREMLIQGDLSDWEMSAVELPRDVWAEADRELTMAWLALRLALMNPQSIRLPDGAILLRLGGPFFAEICLSSLSQPRDQMARVQAGLSLDITFNAYSRFEVAGLSELVTTHTVKGGYDFGARLPKRMFILGAGYSADIRFRGSALFSEFSQSSPHAAAVARIDSEQQEAKRLADDDED